MADVRGEHLCYSDSFFKQLGSVVSRAFALDPAKPLVAGEPRALLVVNDSRVFPSRLHLRRATGGLVEVFLLELPAQGGAACLVRPAKKIRSGEMLFDNEKQAVVKVFCHQKSTNTADESSSSDWTVVPEPGVTLVDLVARLGQVPLPPYIQRPAERADIPRYQTVYASTQGSVAAPTAGLHFTNSLLAEWESQGIERVPVTLHVGLGTFQPVQSDVIEDHKMHEEYYCIPKESLEKIKLCAAKKIPIIYVGTTSFRALESFAQRCVSHSDTQADRWYTTRLFVKPDASGGPSFRPHYGQAMVTNFHQPESTLVMLVAALLGYNNWRELYRHAVESRYRFFSYGDASLLIYANP